MMASIGLGHLCAESVATYPERVREVAQNVELLRDLRVNLRGKLRDTPLFNMGIFRTSFENAMRDAFITYCFENKKDFDARFYANEDGKLLRDCVRAADVIKRGAEKEKYDAEQFGALVDEYLAINSLLLERLFELNKDNANVLRSLVPTAEMVELLAHANDLDTVVHITQAIRNAVIKFA